MVINPRTISVHDKLGPFPFHILSQPRPGQRQSGERKRKRGAELNFLTFFTDYSDWMNAHRWYWMSCTHWAHSLSEDEDENPVNDSWSFCFHHRLPHGKQLIITFSVSQSQIPMTPCWCPLIVLRASILCEWLVLFLSTGRRWFPRTDRHRVLGLV